MNDPKRDSVPADEGRLETPVGQHTPGPWRWWGCKDGSYNPMNDYAQIASGRERVAQVRIASVSEADFRLMVAAPELLQCLRSLYRAPLGQGDYAAAGELLERLGAA
jgi:hypothetical protein